jgi:hypothetical protein
MYSFKVSTKKNKKYDVYKNGKYLLSFGSIINQQYYDKLGHYSNLNHLDQVRRDNYYKRFGKNAKKDTAKWFSHNYLW